MDVLRRGGRVVSATARLWKTAAVEAALCSSKAAPPGHTFRHCSSPAAVLPSSGADLSVAASNALHVARTQGTLENLELPIKNFNLEECGSIVLGGDVFDVPLRTDIVQRVVRWQLAKRRQGTHCTKTHFSEVNRTGKKPYPQKGTGNARHGSLKGPQFRGGVTMHGPKPRSHEIGLQKKVRRLGLKSALSARVAEGKLLVMDNLEPPDHKTKFMSSFVQSVGAKKVLLVDGALRSNEKLRRAAANLYYTRVLPVMGLNVYSILQHDTLIMTADAVKAVEDRLRRTNAKRISEPVEEEVLEISDEKQS